MKAELSIKEIAAKLKVISFPNDPFLSECNKDKRKGVQDLLKKWHRQNEKAGREKELFETMSIHENALRKQGFQSIAGIDEAGRGPLAGPVVAASVILPEAFYLPGLNDSKQLTEAQKNYFHDVIRSEALAIGVGILQSDEIDQFNIYQASKKAMLASVSELSIKPDYLLVDAMVLTVPMPQQSLIKGDAKSISIAAASVIAKVTRDRMMKDYAQQYPQYGFETNMGYGTPFHLEALKRYGPCPWHRKSFAPVAEAVKSRL
ncbi:ribonuclease HII [Peribacillus saganii]|uniref:Ribonuclease HII n=1 Tax=Peribacillus saganii TaxID=2303992 RepID=A0A372LSV6_9BACI|nr:ribonuclease HII [Peribacillus saganii]RFU71268.1 ribonuclease HII [Peribacillus saganii]